MLTIVIIIINVYDCTIWGYSPLGIPAVLTAQYIILNLKEFIHTRFTPSTLANQT